MGYNISEFSINKVKSQLEYLLEHIDDDSVLFTTNNVETLLFDLRQGVAAVIELYPGYVPLKCYEFKRVSDTQILAMKKVKRTVEMVALHRTVNGITDPLDIMEACPVGLRGTFFFPDALHTVEDSLSTWLVSTKRTLSLFPGKGVLIADGSLQD